MADGIDDTAGNVGGPSSSDDAITATSHDADKPRRRRGAIAQRFEQFRADRERQRTDGSNSDTAETIDTDETSDVAETPLVSKVKAQDKRNVQPGAFLPVIDVLSNLAVSRRGKHWNLLPEERQAIAVSIANCAAHLPWEAKETSVIGSIFALVTVLITVIYPRITIDAPFTKTSRTTNTHRPAAGPTAQTSSVDGAASPSTSPGVSDLYHAIVAGASPE